MQNEVSCSTSLALSGAGATGETACGSAGGADLPESGQQEPRILTCFDEKIIPFPHKLDFKGLSRWLI